MVKPVINYSLPIRYGIGSSGTGFEVRIAADLLMKEVLCSPSSLFRHLRG